MAVAETIGERLRRVREERGLTQRDICAPGVSPQYISKVERGERVPSVKALRKLGANLGVSAQFLETGHDLAEAAVLEFRLDDAELALRLGEDPSTVEATLVTLLDEADGAGDTRASVRARLALGIVTSHRGDHDAAISQLEPAISEAWVTPSTHPDAFATLAHSYTVVRRESDAVTLLQSCIEQLSDRRPFDGPAIARFATYLSYALADMGELEEAREAIATALQHGRGSDDPYTTIRLYWSKARLEAQVGDYELAQASVNRAIGLLELTEDTAYQARAHLLAAEISLWDGDLREAEEHLETAEKILPAGSPVEDQAFLLIQQAFLAARTDNAAAAMDYANRAIAILGDREDPTIRGQAQWALGEAFAVAGAVASARAAFTRAGELMPPGSKYATQLLEAWQRAVPSEVR